MGVGRGGREVLDVDEVAADLLGDELQRVERGEHLDVAVRAAPAARTPAGGQGEGGQQGGRGHDGESSQLHENDYQKV
ncbi:hypothetical protein GCM10007967_33980 [Xylanimonas ulmi]